MATEKQKIEQKKKRGNPQNLKPFKKGQSGNPKGRPKKGHAIADILNEIGEEKVTVNGLETTKKRVVLMKVYAEALKGQNWAVHFIADRTEGKAVEKIEVNDTTIRVGFVDD